MGNAMRIWSCLVMFNANLVIFHADQVIFQAMPSNLIIFYIDNLLCGQGAARIKLTRRHHGRMTRYLILRTLNYLCPYSIAYRRASGLFTFGLFKKSL